MNYKECEADFSVVSISTCNIWNTFVTFLSTSVTDFKLYIQNAISRHARRHKRFKKVSTATVKFISIHFIDFDLIMNSYWNQGYNDFLDYNAWRVFEYFVMSIKSIWRTTAQGRFSRTNRSTITRQKKILKKKKNTNLCFISRWITARSEIIT